MLLKFVRFINLLLVALTLGMTFCHALEYPGKVNLSGPEWLTVQHNVYIAFGVVGAALIIGFIVWTKRKEDQLLARAERELGGSLAEELGEEDPAA